MGGHFCNYEHLGGCSSQLTHRVDYWLGMARKRFGRYAYYCSAHASLAAHLGVQTIKSPKRRGPKADVIASSNAA